eukprot:188523-Chlamydomonas_euryale.AAC.2
MEEGGVAERVWSGRVDASECGRGQGVDAVKVWRSDRHSQSWDKASVGTTRSDRHGGSVEKVRREGHTRVHHPHLVNDGHTPCAIHTWSHWQGEAVPGERLGHLPPTLLATSTHPREPPVPHLVDDGHT